LLSIEPVNLLINLTNRSVDYTSGVLFIDIGVVFGMCMSCRLAMKLLKLLRMVLVLVLGLIHLSKAVSILLISLEENLM
jgi:hypothetical protein